MRRFWEAVRSNTSHMFIDNQLVISKQEKKKKICAVSTSHVAESGGQKKGKEKSPFGLWVIAHL